MDMAQESKSIFCLDSGLQWLCCMLQVESIQIVFVGPASMAPAKDSCAALDANA